MEKNYLLVGRSGLYTLEGFDLKWKDLSSYDKPIMTYSQYGYHHMTNQL